MSTATRQHVHLHEVGIYPDKKDQSAAAQAIAHTVSALHQDGHPDHAHSNVRAGIVLSEVNPSGRWFPGARIAVPMASAPQELIDTLSEDQILTPDPFYNPQVFHTLASSAHDALLAPQMSGSQWAHIATFHATGVLTYNWTPTGSNGSEGFAGCTFAFGNGHHALAMWDRDGNCRDITSSVDLSKHLTSRRAGRLTTPPTATTLIDPLWATLDGAQKVAALHENVRGHLNLRNIGDLAALSQSITGP